MPLETAGNWHPLARGWHAGTTLGLVPKGSERSQAQREALRERLHLAIGDMDDTVAAARWLIATHPASAGDLPWQVRVVLEAGLFATFARSFNKSKGDPGLPAAPTSGLTAEQRRVLQWAKDERDTAWAHIDRAGPRRALQTSSGEMMTTWRPPNSGELHNLAELAELLAARYRAEVAELEALIQERLDVGV